jgi:hypothetical protein
MVPSWIPISVNDALRFGFGSSARASASARPDQFDRPPGRTATLIVGLFNVTSAISNRPARSGK